jgi:hypothetical protein
VGAYARSAARRQHVLAALRKKVQEARAQGIGISGSSEEMVKSLVRAFSKRKRDEFDEENGSADKEDTQETPKRQRRMDQTPMGGKYQYPGRSQSSELVDSDTLSSLSSLESRLTSEIA